MLLLLRVNHCWLSVTQVQLPILLRRETWYLLLELLKVVVSNLFLFQMYVVNGLRAVISSRCSLSWWSKDCRSAILWTAWGHALAVLWADGLKTVARLWLVKFIMHFCKFLFDNSYEPFVLRLPSKYIFFLWGLNRLDPYASHQRSPSPNSESFAFHLYLISLGPSLSDLLMNPEY